MSKLIEVDKIEWQKGVFVNPNTEEPLPIIHKIATIEMLRDFQEEVKAIPIPKGATFGGMVTTMLNPYKICEHEYNVHVYMTEEDFLKADYQMNCSADLWNAPYKKEV
jgi:hypothetical protein